MKKTAFIILLLSTMALLIAWWYLPTQQAPPAVTVHAQCPMHPAVQGTPADKCTLCGMDLVAGSAGSETAATAAVVLPPETLHVVGIRTTEIKKQPLVRTLRISGMIGEDDSRHGVISAPVAGRVDGLSMNHEGQTVTQRQPLATIFSPTWLAAAKVYKDAVATGGQPLADAKRQLEQLGLVWEQIQTIPDRQADDLYFGMLSPRSGTIVKSYVAEGQTVKAGQRMFEIADFTKMWFHAMIPEQDLPFIKVGQSVKLHTASLPGVTLASRVYNISPNLGEMNGGAKVRVVLENPDRTIRNNLFAQGSIETESEETLAVPRTAVLWPGNTPRVYIQVDPGYYEARNLKLGRSGDTHYEVLEGLKEGDTVVTTGNMLIDSQAQLNQP